MNGRCFVSGVPGDTAVDLDTISTDFIDRVELLTGGASATYGSDAVAGVVDIILKKNFNGVRLDAQTGRSNEGDDFKKKLAPTFGIIEQRCRRDHGGQHQCAAQPGRRQPDSHLDRYLDLRRDRPAPLFALAHHLVA